MAYTPSPYRTKTIPNNFGGFTTDGNRVAMPFGSSIQTQDATGTPVTSPLTMSGSTQTLTVPQAAKSVTITAFTTTVQVSEDSTMSTYDVVPISGSKTYEVTRQQYVYLKGTSPNLTAFVFSMV